MPLIGLCKTNEYIQKPQKVVAHSIKQLGVGYLSFTGTDIDYVSKLVINYPKYYNLMTDYEKLSKVDNSLQGAYKSKYKKTKLQFVIFGISMGVKDVAVAAGLIYLGSQVINLNL